ncbi:MAG TPA: AAA family ATPase [Bryobacteraceae bacterium]|nr:AAA family ATPase [Bryobacteraceae bacterium]
MYEAAFGLTKKPFGMTPDPAALYLTPAHREALTGLAYGVMRRKGCIVLIGDAGTGKTTLLRKLLLTLPTPSVESSVLISPTLTPSEFLEMVLEDFKIGGVPSSKAQRLLRMRDFLADVHRAGKVAVLIVDEAHKLGPDVLEEVRLLTNFETNEDKLLQIVLAGQTELGDLLNRQELRQLKQRVAVRLEIGPLSHADLAQYLQFRWQVAGGTAPLPFSAEAIRAVGLWSRGIPRLVNAICDNALLLACGDGLKVIGGAHIDEVARDFQLAGDAPPLPERRNLPAAVAPEPAYAAVGSAEHRETARAPEWSPGALPILERYATEQSRSLLGRWAARFGL